MIVCQNTTANWFRVDTELGPVAFFQDIRDRETEDRAAGRSTWVAVEPLDGLHSFGPVLGVARIRLEHVTLFGVTED